MDRYLYLFTLSYHIRKSGRKHFPTLMSTLHHQSSLTQARANSAKLTYSKYRMLAITERKIESRAFNQRGRGEIYL